MLTRANSASIAAVARSATDVKIGPIREPIGQDASGGQLGCTNTSWVSTALYMSSIEMRSGDRAKTVPPLAPVWDLVMPARPSIPMILRMTAELVLARLAISSEPIGTPSFTAMTVKICVATARRELSDMQEL